MSPQGVITKWLFVTFFVCNAFYILSLLLAMFITFPFATEVLEYLITLR